MKLTTAAAFTLLSATGVMAHPEHMTAEIAREEAKLAGRSTNKCAAAIEKRKADMMQKRAESLYRRRVESGHIQLDERSMTSPVKRNTLQYQEIQNNTCVLAPDTIWGPYGYVLGGFIFFILFLTFTSLRHCAHAIVFRP